MKLSDMLFSNSKYISSSNNTGQSVTVDPYQQQRLSQELSRLKPGQTLQGEVISKNGSEVQIKLNDDLVLTARLDKNMDIEPGRTVTFEVKNNGGGTLALTPLFENMGTDANVLKALNMAGLPVNGTTIKMTEEMMRAGMSVDKSSMQNMFKHIVGNQGAQPSSVVTLQKLGIDITPQNLQQLENYKNLEHQIIKDMSNVMDELSVQYESMTTSGDIKEAVSMYQAVLDFIVSDGAEDTLQNAIVSGEADDLPGNADANGNLISDATIKSGFAEQQNLQTLLDMTEGLADDATENIKDINVAKQLDDGIVSASKDLTDTSKQITQYGEAPVSTVLSKNELSSFVQQLQSIGVSEQTLQAVNDGTLQVKDILAEISRLLSNHPETIKEDISHQIFSDKGFQTLVKNSLTDQWMLMPEDVQSKDKVAALYERLNSQLSKLSEALAGKVSEDSPLAKSVTNIQHNIDFMNQLNQMYAYVQLPLKMSEGNAHGDLYVYANKKGLAYKDGNVSALLHLDMENLGPVDVYVAMQNQKVNTHFYLPDEEMLDFIEKHIYILDERLEKKGYAMNTVMSVKGEEKTAVEEIIDNGKNMTTLSHYSFDVRA